MPPIYHITHLRNLAPILGHRCLWCDRERLGQGLVSVGIAYQHIKDRRARKRVPVGRGGTLADYVPFYFAPRSPMLYAIHKGQVPSYDSGQSSVVHLVTSTEAVIAEPLPFVFTNGHADMAFSRFYDDLRDLDQVDWAIMGERYWNDTPEDGDRKRRRQAEFLVYRSLPWHLVAEIGVISRAVAEEVGTALEAAEHRPPVVVRPGWYY
jgi:hypothetical protein